MTSALPTELTSRPGAGHNVGSNCSSSSYYFTEFYRRPSPPKIQGCQIDQQILGLDEHTVYNLVPLEKP